jgi:putative ABC transport system permease protein
MGIIQAYKLAIASILSAKVRSFLTMLGVIVGVGSVITAVGFAQGSTKSISDQIKGLGSNLIQITINNRGGNRGVTFDQLQKFADEHVESIAGVAPTVSASVTAKYGNQSHSTTILGTNSDYEFIRNMHVQEGRFLLSLDTELRQKVAVIGTAIVNKLYVDRDPIGETINLNGNVFTVVGVLQQKANGQESSDDDQIVIPVSVAQRLASQSVLRNFAIQAVDSSQVNAVMDQLNTFLFSIYNNSSAYRVFNQAQILSTLDTVTSTLTVILSGIAMISLIVGGIGIMNIMLVSVTERTKEIGIRKAIGAKKRDIMMQFLIEAIVVTGFGGLLGILIGLSLIKFVIGGLGIVPEVYSMTWILISFGISIVVGVVFGLFPAYRAANLNPIEALRFE